MNIFFSDAFDSEVKTNKMSFTIAVKQQADLWVFLPLKKGIIVWIFLQFKKGIPAIV